MARDKDLDLNTSGNLPEGSSLQGATRKSMGGYNTAAVKRGYGNAEDMSDKDVDDGTGANECCDELPQPYGFLGRSQGWER